MKLHISSDIFLWFGLLLFGISGFFFTTFVEPPHGFYLFVVVAALGGFGVSSYIWYSKSRGKQLVCPSGGDCNAVVNSQYAKFFGIHLEYLGMAYFFTIFGAYSLILLLPHVFHESFRVAVLLLTTSAALFSSYLLFVQAFLLRKWCIWCILAAMFSLTIVFTSLISAAGVIAFLDRAHTLLNLLKFFGFALGMGGATIVLFLFTRFLTDLGIDEKELSAIKDVVEVVWLGLGLVVMSLFAGYVAYPSASGPFLAQMLALFGVAFAGAVFMIIYAPFLVYVPFAKKPGEGRRQGLAALRRPAFVTGGVAVFSWYFAFAMNFISEYSFPALLVAYGGVLILAVFASMLWELRYGR